MKSLVVLRTHILTPAIEALFDKMTRDLGADRVYMLYDDTRNPYPNLTTPTARIACVETPINPAARVLLANDTESVSVNSMHDKGYGHTASWAFWHPETTMVMVYDYAQRAAKTFDYIWFVEYDVRCHGSFSAAFDACDGIDADFMAKGRDDRFELRRGDRDPWCWWSSLVGEITAVPQERQVGVFFPLTRFSRAAFETLRANFGRSTGFSELYTSTLCFNKGLVVMAMPREVFGVFQYQPNISDDEYAAMTAGLAPTGLFFHPIKS
jgi:hypothetical protein